MALEKEDPDSLEDLCINFLAKIYKLLCQPGCNSSAPTLHEHLFLTTPVAEKLLGSMCKNYKIDDSTVSLFDPVRARLQSIDVCHQPIHDTSIRKLLAHEPQSLNISSCSLCGEKTLCYLNDKILAFSLRSIFLGNWQRFVPAVTDYSLIQNFTFANAPNLMVLSVKNISSEDFWEDRVLNNSLLYYQHLKVLELEHCTLSSLSMQNISNLSQLTSLILYDSKFTISSLIQALASLPKLRLLDVSQSKPALYSDETEHLTSMVELLPDLQHLDISNTNLAGFEPPERQTFSLKSELIEKTRVLHPICGLSCLNGRLLEFLGLLNCPYSACERKNLPAKQVTGDANENQVLLSVEAYIHRHELLKTALKDLFDICKDAGCKQVERTILLVVKAMKNNLKRQEIQISGSASLFYIGKMGEEIKFCVKVKRLIITAILDAMESHPNETTVMRNGCLTLCHFDIPKEVLFDYKRLVVILLHMVSPKAHEDFVIQAGIYILNGLACFVGDSEKKDMGELGAIEKMIEIILHKLTERECDTILEIAWSMMWNVTDESPMNCSRFIEAGGLVLFFKCLDAFPNKMDVLRNMMGLLGNIAEVEYLRKMLLEEKFINVFRLMLESREDKIEISYNACGVLAHIMSDGAAVWNISEPPRSLVLQEMRKAIDRWPIKTKRNINYKSFKPILCILENHTSPEAQHWAAWALDNLSLMYPEKYCDLIVREKGLDKLEKLLSNNLVYADIQELARHVIMRCQQFRRDPKSVVSPVMDEQEDAS